jgi:hypothetical protein
LDWHGHPQLRNHARFSLWLSADTSRQLKAVAVKKPKG